MDRLDAISGPMKASLSAARIRADDVQVVAESDMDVDGRFGQSWLVVSDRELVSIDAHGAIIRRLPFDDVRAVRVESLVGGAALLADVGSEACEMARYSNAGAGKFGYLARWLTEGVEHRNGKRDDEPVWDYKPQKKFCPSCGLPLPDEFSPCPACSKKSQALRRILGYLRPYTTKAVLLTVFSVIGISLELIPPYFTRILIDDVLVVPEAIATTPATPVFGDWFRGMRTVAVALAVAVSLVGVSYLLATVLAIVRGCWSCWFPTVRTMGVVSGG